MKKRSRRILIKDIARAAETCQPIERFANESVKLLVKNMDDIEDQYQKQ